MKKIQRYVTVEMLKKMYACDKQLRLFRRVFGNSARITKRNLSIAAQRGLDLNFFAEMACGVYGLMTCMCELCRPTPERLRSAKAEAIAAVPKLWTAIKDRIA